mmetsp:Transcript_103118/g.290062  ORF Transcript_103118/g.290062 Transcript_103118/m.290062 type:complete len:279 (-) Transcript_103118:328-1164(-)
MRQNALLGLQGHCPPESAICNTNVVGQLAIEPVVEQHNLRPCACPARALRRELDQDVAGVRVAMHEAVGEYHCRKDIRQASRHLEAELPRLCLCVLRQCLTELPSGCPADLSYGYTFSEVHDEQATARQRLVHCRDDDQIRQRWMSCEELTASDGVSRLTFEVQLEQDIGLELIHRPSEGEVLLAEGHAREPIQPPRDDQIAVQNRPDVGVLNLHRNHGAVMQNRTMHLGQRCAAQRREVKFQKGRPTTNQAAVGAQLQLRTERPLDLPEGPRGRPIL